MLQVSSGLRTTNHHKLWTEETARLVQEFPASGVFLTGIEGSDPHVDGLRRNQLREAHDFYVNYESRLKNIRELGITWLRFGAPYSQVHPQKDSYDFHFVDSVVKTCQDLGITIMADLLHFGLPDWIHEHYQEEPFFQNSFFPQEFARYAYTFAKRYPHIRHYTLVNEPFVTAYLSAKLGLWNEHRSTPWHDDRDFVRAVANIARAAILARQAIDQLWVEEDRPDSPIYIQNESFEVAIAAPGCGRENEVKRFNLRRFAPIDLILGYRDGAMKEYLLSQGMSEYSYEWFMQNGQMDKTVLGIDHYPTCVHTFEKDRVIDHNPQQPYQLAEVVRTYWERYPLPLLHTEVNGWPNFAVDLCQKTYDTLNQLRHEGYPVLGMGWYGDELQVGWHVAMRGPQAQEENPVGLFYKGQPQPVASHFQHLVNQGFA